jgi:hypothetical protein
MTLGADAGRGANILWRTASGFVHRREGKIETQRSLKIHAAVWELSHPPFIHKALKVF